MCHGYSENSVPWRRPIFFRFPGMSRCVAVSQSSNSPMAPYCDCVACLVFDPRRRFGAKNWQWWRALPKKSRVCMNKNTTIMPHKTNRIPVYSTNVHSYSLCPNFPKKYSYTYIYIVFIYIYIVAYIYNVHIYIYSYIYTYIY